MEKALKFLKRMKQTDTPYNFRECELDEAIAELEEAQLTRREWYQKGYNEAMKPKTCDGCSNNHKDRTIFYDGKKALMCTFCKYGAVSYFKPNDNA